MDVRAGADLLLFRAVELQDRRRAFTRTKDVEGLRLCSLFDLLVRIEGASNWRTENWVNRVT